MSETLKRDAQKELAKRELARRKLIPFVKYRFPWIYGELAS